MDLRKIKKLIELVEESGISELEVKSGEEAVRIVRSGATQPAAVTQPTTKAAEPAVAVPSARATIKAPMSGTFYRSPEPGAAPYISVGDEVASGAVVCIIESMKMMNEITALEGGRCVEILVMDGEPITTGQALIRIG
ncbi:MAG: acetyl-CoA carboxylase biotin carboxyl carrier protein [Proteobacteria bacterium]|nr:acetyl-CoA carboxylase biotin carboxyl carrier protein [Pseudomonadota bacterium]